MVSSAVCFNEVRSQLLNKPHHERHHKHKLNFISSNPSRHSIHVAYNTDLHIKEVGQALSNQDLRDGHASVTSTDYSGVTDNNNASVIFGNQTTDKKGL